MKTCLRPGPWFAAGLLLSAVARAVNPSATPTPDAPCQVYQKATAVYPLRLLHQGVTHGRAQLVAEINPEGKIGDVLVTGYTHRPFADAALAAFKEWQFKPGYVGGQAITSILTVDFEFETSGVLAHEATFDTKELSRTGSAFAYQPHGIASLDRRPGRPRGDEPIYPRAWIQERRFGSVMVEFFIDETGRARLPTLSEEDEGDPLLGAAALAAVKTWQFEPPTHRGRPVLARAVQLFVFEQPQPAEDPKRERG